MLRPQRIREQPLAGPSGACRKTERRTCPAIPLADTGGSDRTAVAAVAMDEPGGLGRYPRQALAQAQLLQHARRVGREGDGRADLTQFGGLLENLGGDAPLGAAVRASVRPADTGSDAHYRQRAA